MIKIFPVSTEKIGKPQKFRPVQLRGDKLKRLQRKCL